MRDESHGGDAGERRVREHGRNRGKRIGALVVQVEDDDRGRASAHLGQRGCRRSSECQPQAELVCRRLDLRGEHEVVKYCEDHVTAMIVESRAVPPFMKNGFVVAGEQSREAVLIDPGDEVEDLLAIVARAISPSSTFF